MKTLVNGVKFLPSEMDIIWKALELKASNALSCELMFDVIATQDRQDMPRKQAKKNAKAAKKDQERALSAQQKWHRVCLGWTDEYAAEIRARRENAHP